MNQDANEERFITAVKAALDHRLESLDDETIERLAKVRRRVLQETTIRRPRWVQAGGLAAVAASALLVVSLWFMGEGSRGAPELMPFMEDLELLGAKQDIKFFEDLDFYLWLADEQQTG